MLLERRTVIHLETNFNVKKKILVTSFFCFPILGRQHMEDKITKFSWPHKPLIASVICCKLQETTSFNTDFIHIIYTEDLLRRS